ncbi:hypothetical protein DRW41_17200 [Neobacillus piezotolerans]|uniref:Uncharacterized protein n=1 Tax=Neobacillus piezotolerans TaxID=2259171 RepID=A0A3D8GMF6_9BACI|nr:hypothetical protein [Neobacillus piezotolerans]RDU35477.1 hypothetical protein DRW41_17200 [Neobacillus piezotolerans]
MRKEIYDESRLIELCGTVKRFISKSYTKIMFTFEDEIHGELILVAHYDSILYYNLKRKGKYRLFVALKGHVNHKESGQIFTNNALVVRKVVQPPR